MKNSSPQEVQFLPWLEDSVM
ncbi:hypothetical protein MG7_04894, partial [Candida albicans P34048]